MLLVLQSSLYSIMVTSLTLISAKETSPKDLAILQDKCYSHFGSCNNRTEEYENDIAPGCMCDKACAKYGDCCLDSKYFNRTEQRIAVYSFTCTMRTQWDDYIYIKKNCPPSWSDMETIELCKKADSNDPSDPLLIRPVKSIRSTTVYGNIFCAKCNSEARTSEDIEFIGEQTMYCVEPKGILRSEVTGNNFRYNETKGEWQFVYKNTFYGCYLRTDLSKSSEHLRHCFPWIKTCPSTWSDSDIREQCESYTFPIHRQFEGQHIVYRNIHCAICNNGNDHLVCPYWGLVLSPIGEVLEFPLLFNTHRNDMLGTQKPSADICDNLSNTCRKIFD